MFYFFLVRWIYFVLLLTGEMNDAPYIIDILLAEFPTYFTLSIFCLILFWWIELYHYAVVAKNQFLERSKYLFIILNIVVYILLIALIIVFVSVPNDKTISCFNVDSSTSLAAITVGKVYQSIVSFIALFITIGFIIYGSMLIKRLYGSNDLSSSAKTQVFKFTAVTSLCSIGLLLQVSLLLYTTYATSINTVAAVILEFVAELIPASVLLYATGHRSAIIKAIQQKFFSGEEVFTDSSTTRSIDDRRRSAIKTNSVELSNSSRLKKSIRK